MTQNGSGTLGRVQTLTRPAPAACIWLLATAIWSGPGHADADCPGSIAGTVLAPLPASALVQLDTPAQDATNPGLVRQFISGLQQSGIAVTADGTGNVVLSLAVSVTPSAGNAQGPAAGTYRNLGWASGDARPTNWNIRGTKLSLSAEATNTGTASLAWLGTLECTVMTSDPGRLAGSLGVAIGQAIGRASGRNPF
jgi:hypothetical protein